MESESFGEKLEKFIISSWKQIFIIFLCYLIWRYNLIKDVLAIVGVYVLGRIAWKFWLHYIQNDFISGIEFVVLEIIPPRDVLRSPKAMELFFTNALYHWSQKGGKEEFWQGAVWLWFSLEIVSIEGQVHFYIRTPSRIKNLIETQMYAQYPQAQVKVVEDYTLAVDEISEKSKWMAWGCEWKLLKPEAFPIKTYVDFGLDKDPKEEFKVDPISPVIEFFGSIGKGEQAWLQIIVRPSKKEYHTKGTWFGKHDWVQEAQYELQKLLAPYSSYKDAKTLDDIGIGRSRIEIRVPPFFDRAMKSMNAKTSKIGFDTGIRLLYVAKKEVYTVNRRKDIRLIFRQYAMPDVNGIVRHNATQGDAIGSGIFSLSQKQVMTLANRMLVEYQERACFHHPLRHQFFNEGNFVWLAKFVIKPFFLPYFHSVHFVLNTEELATLWHFPGQILKVPTLERIESKEASPPTNLPM